MKLFDLHCDSLIKFKEYQDGFLCPQTAFSLRDKEHFSRLCQVMAVFIPDELRGEEARRYFHRHRDYLLELLHKEGHLAELARSAGDIERITKAGKAAVILAVESGAVLAGNIEDIAELARCGVRMMTLVWNGKNELGSGHQTDEGLSGLGRRAVKSLEEEGIIVDVSHLNDRGFEEVCELAEKPFIASHSNLRSVCSHRRNLTDGQFREIVRRRGLVGLNLYEPFLAEEGEGSVDVLYRHISRMLELGGEDVIACGSDFDGADIHSSLDTPLKFARSAEYLLSRGMKERLVDKIYYENALAFWRQV